jgi:hypothetical protein
MRHVKLHSETKALMKFHSQTEGDLKFHTETKGLSLTLALGQVEWKQFRKLLQIVRNIRSGSTEKRCHY